MGDDLANKLVSLIGEEEYGPVIFLERLIGMCVDGKLSLRNDNANAGCGSFPGKGRT